MVFHGHAHCLQAQRDFTAQVEQLVLGWNGMIAAMQRNIMTVAAGAAIPISFVAIQAVRCAVHTVFKGHVIEDIKLELWSPPAMIGNPGAAQIGLSPDGNIARIVDEHSMRISFQGRADEA